MPMQCDDTESNNNLNTKSMNLSNSASTGCEVDHRWHMFGENFGRNFAHLYANEVSEQFTFPSCDPGHSLQLREVMAEAKVTAYFPSVFLKAVVECYNRRLLAFEELSYLSAKQEAMRQTHVKLLRKVLKSYELAINTCYRRLEEEPKLYYKASCIKAETDTEFLPTNLHIQRMQVCSEHTPDIVRNFDFLTSGCFAAISRGFKTGLMSAKAKLFAAVSKPLCLTAERAEDVFDIWAPLWQLFQHRERVELILGSLADIAVQCISKQQNGLLLDVDLSKAVVLYRAALEECWEVLAALRTFASERDLYKAVDELYLHFVASHSEKTTDTGKARANSVPLQQHQQQFVEKAMSMPPGTAVQNSDSCAQVDTRCRSSSVGVQPPSQCEDTNKNLENSNIAQSSPLSKSADGHADLVHSMQKSSSIDSSAQSMKTFEVWPSDSFAGDLEARMSLFAIKVDTLDTGSEGLSNEAREQWIKDVGQSALLAADLLRQFSCVIIHAVQYRFMCVLRNAGLTEFFYMTEYRQNVAVCQALTAVTAGALHQFWTADLNTLSQCVIPPSLRLGLLFCFNSYLSSFRNEYYMLEDYAEALKVLAKRTMLKFVRHTAYLNGVLSSKTSCPSSAVSITGLPSKFHVIIPVPDDVFSAIPEALRKGQMINIVPILFTIGINEEATIGHNFGDRILEPQINCSSFALLKNYVEFVLDDTAKENCIGPRNMQLIRQLLNDLDAELSAPKEKQYKNVGILHLVSQLCSLLRGVQYLTCKSGKDRTSMGVTVEEAFVLMRHYHLPEVCLQKALNTLRADGTRRSNVMKNTGTNYYAFSSLRTHFLPELYKPPPGSFSGSVQT